jgi:GNAT superfamily N-acetyltransferase
MAVTATAEELGVVRRLLEVVEQWAWVEGYRSTALDTFGVNQWARRFYARHG